ncbi:MAG: TonB-dependent receptor [Bacteroidetes bacterium]|nr:TonB-dependent receptor [Bacteroidota bacterium]
MGKFILTFFLLISAWLPAQNSQCNIIVLGIVVDSLENKALGNTHIEIIGSKKSANINIKDSIFTIQNVCGGLLEIHFSHLDCEHKDIVFNITKDTFITVYLNHTALNIGSAKVASKTIIERVTIQGEGSLKIANTLTEQLESSASIRALKTGNNASKPVVNGLHSNRVILVNNGIKQEGQNWGLEHAPEIDANFANDIQVVENVGKLRYTGDAIGGLIVISTKDIFKLNSKPLQGIINTIAYSNGRGYGTNAWLGGKLLDSANLYYQVQGTYRKNGNTFSPQYILANTGSEERNYAAEIGYNKKQHFIKLYYSSFYNQLGIFKGSHIGNLNDLQLAMNSPLPLVTDNFKYTIDRPKQELKHQVTKLQYLNKITNNNELEINLAYQKNNRKEFDILRSSSAFDGPSFNYFLTTYLLDVVYYKHKYHGTNISTGGQLQYQENAFKGRFFVPGYKQLSSGGFFSLGKGISKEDKKTKNYLEGGLRLDNKQLIAYLWKNNTLSTKQQNFTNASYYFKLKIGNQKHDFSISTESAWRPPSVNELYSNGLHQGLASIEIGDTGLKAERNYQTTISYGALIKKSTLSIVAFYNYIPNFINLEPSLPAQLTIRGAFPVFKYQQYNAAISGLNIDFTSKIKINRKRNIENHLISAVLWGNNLSKKQPITQMPPISIKNSIGYNKNYKVIMLWARYTFKQYRYLPNSDYLPPPNAFLLFGVYAGYPMKLKKQSIIFNLSINNLLNNKYRDYLNRFRYFANEQGTDIKLKISTSF